MSPRSSVSVLNLLYLLTIARDRRVMAGVAAVPKIFLR